MHNTIMRAARGLQMGSHGLHTSFPWKCTYSIAGSRRLTQAQHAARGLHVGCTWAACRPHTSRTPSTHGLHGTWVTCNSHPASHGLQEGFPRIYWVFLVILGYPWHSWTLLGSSGFYWALLGSPGLSRALLSSPGLFLVIVQPFGIALDCLH